MGLESWDQVGGKLLRIWACTAPSKSVHACEGFCAMSGPALSKGKNENNPGPVKFLYPAELKQQHLKPFVCCLSCALKAFEYWL